MQVAGVSVGAVSRRRSLRSVRFASFRFSRSRFTQPFHSQHIFFASDLTVFPTRIKSVLRVNIRAQKENYGPCSLYHSLFRVNIRRTIHICVCLCACMRVCVAIHVYWVRVPVRLGLIGSSGSWQYLSYIFREKMDSPGWLIFKALAACLRTLNFSGYYKVLLPVIRLNDVEGLLSGPPSAGAAGNTGRNGGGEMRLRD